VATTDAGLPGGRYGLVLLALVVSYVITAFITGPAAAALAAVLYALTMLLALRTSGLRPAASHRLRLALVLGTFMAAGLIAPRNKIADGLTSVWFALLLLTTIVIILRRVLSDSEVTIQTVLGALSTYMMIGLMFAAIYSAIGHFISTPLFAHNNPVNANTLQYFSFTTLTTLGYGDFVAAGDAGRAIATLEALTGQIFLATFVARLVASYIPRGPSSHDSGG
jgi:hypothetical protein